ncbi:MAG: hypothetical protein HC811_04550 [Flammeovirgaceae bacterium]|nr:hypothetical protein [Flammeovirgaceae bacterium]
MDELGDVYLRTKNYELAEEALLKSFEITKDHEVHALKVLTPLKIARLYQETNQADLSMAYLDTAEFYCTTYNNELGKTQVNLGRSRVYLSLKNTMRQRH